MTPLGSLAIGSAAEQVGLTTAVGVAGCACVLLGLETGRRARRAEVRSLA